jgi:hypothetical protein
MAKTRDDRRSGDCPQHGENRPRGCTGNCPPTDATAPESSPRE